MKLGYCGYCGRLVYVMRVLERIPGVQGALDLCPVCQKQYEAS